MHKEVGLSALLYVDYLPKTMDFEENAGGGSFGIKILKLENGEINSDSNNFPLLWSINLFCNERGASFIVIYSWIYCSFYSILK